MRGAWRLHLPFYARLAAFACLALALARPQLGYAWEESLTEGIDIQIVLDISGSMGAEDFQPRNRLSVAKQVVKDFISGRPGDRIGLVVFGFGAYLQVPLTLDHDAVISLLHETRIGMAGPQTSIGDAIGLAIRLFEKSTAPQKVVILMTDGNDTGSRVPPAKASQIAADKGITLYTIALGDPKATGGEVVDTKLLTDIATRTGGQFYLATDRQRLEAIYDELDTIQKQTFKTLSYRPKRPLFQWPLGAAMALGAVYLLVEASLAAWRWRRLPA
jgi:Ca-activated chloride channel family protein